MINGGGKMAGIFTNRWKEGDMVSTFTPPKPAPSLNLSSLFPFFLSSFFFFLFSFF